MGSVDAEVLTQDDILLIQCADHSALIECTLIQCTLTQSSMGHHPHPGSYRKESRGPYTAALSPLYNQ